MARPREPLAVVQAKGLKHLTKAEIQERQDREIKPVTDNIVAPGYLTKKQKDYLTEQKQHLTHLQEDNMAIRDRP